MVKRRNNLEVCMKAVDEFYENSQAMLRDSERGLALGREIGNLSPRQKSDFEEYLLDTLKPTPKLQKSPK